MPAWAVMLSANWVFPEEGGPENSITILYGTPRPQSDCDIEEDNMPLCWNMHNLYVPGSRWHSNLRLRWRSNLGLRCLSCDLYWFLCGSSCTPREDHNSIHCCAKLSNGAYDSLWYFALLSNLGFLLESHLPVWREFKTQWDDNPTFNPIIIVGNS